MARARSLEQGWGLGLADVAHSVLGAPEAGWAEAHPIANGFSVLDSLCSAPSWLWLS